MTGSWQGWVPYRIQASPEGPVCRWLFVGPTAFTQPFFEETIASVLSLPENSFGPPRVTPLSALPLAAAELDTLEPSAFVFHVSRCGSTLVSQLLSLETSCVVLSEVPFLDQLLRARFRPGLQAVDVAKSLPAAIRLHGQRRNGTERSLVIKLDSWHTGLHAELRALYPQTPFILLYREPAAVVQSHQRRPGMHAVRGLVEDTLFHFGPEAAERALADHLPAVLGFYYDTFLEIARTDPRVLLVAYQRDMIPVVEAIAAFAGIELSDSTRTAWAARAAFHAKQPGQRFDEAQVEGPLDPRLRDCHSRCQALERFRCAMPSKAR